LVKGKIEKVIKEIFSPMLLGDELPNSALNSPITYKQIRTFAKLIVNEEPEESFQRYISKNPNFLFRLAPSTDDTSIGFLAKPPISNFNTADYGIFSVSQGGTRIFLIEIEKPSDVLFTQKLTPAKKLQMAIGQTHDWGQWIRNNKHTFVNTCFKILQSVPKYPAKSHNGSFIYCDREAVANLWNGFGGTENCTIEYLIVIGRWSQLKKPEKERLMFMNSKFQQENLRIRTYDNLVRKAIDGPKYLW